MRRGDQRWCLIINHITPVFSKRPVVVRRRGKDGRREGFDINIYPAYYDQNVRDEDARDSHKDHI